LFFGGLLQSVLTLPGGFDLGLPAAGGSQEQSESQDCERGKENSPSGERREHGAQFTHGSGLLDVDRMREESRPTLIAAMISTAGAESRNGLK
jgi:hypothetical protein